MLKNLVIVLLVIITGLSVAGCNNNTPSDTTTPASVITDNPPAVTTTVATTPTVNPTTPTTTTTPTVPAFTTPLLSAILQSKYVTARFFGIMSLDYQGTMMSYATEMVIASVPVTWSGFSFSGKLEEIGSGEDVTDLVSGTVSDDGSQILGITYSRRIIRDNGTGLFYQVALTNLPLNGAGAPSAPGVFEQAGDVKQYFVKVEYVDGSIDAGGNITPSTRYVSTDWTNTNTGQKPMLKVAIEQVASQISIIHPVNQ